MTDLIRHDIPYRDSQEPGVSGRKSRGGASARRRTTSRSPRDPNFSPELGAGFPSSGFRPIRSEQRFRSASALPQSASGSGTRPILPPLGSYLDPALSSGPYGPLLMQGLLYQQQQARNTSGWEAWNPNERSRDRAAPPVNAAQDPNLGPLLSIINQREAQGQRSSNQPGPLRPEPVRPTSRVNTDEEDANFALEYGGMQMDLRQVRFPEGWPYQM